MGTLQFEEETVCEALKPSTCLSSMLISILLAIFKQEARWVSINHLWRQASLISAYRGISGGLPAPTHPLGRLMWGRFSSCTCGTKALSPCWLQECCLTFTSYAVRTGRQPSCLLCISLPVAGRSAAVSSPSGLRLGQQLLSGCAAPTTQGEQGCWWQQAVAQLDVVSCPFTCGGQS